MEKEIMASMHATYNLPLELSESLVKKITKKQAPIISGTRRNTHTSTYHQWIYSLIRHQNTSQKIATVRRR